MIGGIYENKTGKGSRYILRFKSITRRSDNLQDLERMLTGMQYEIDRGKFDPRDYRKDQPLGFTNISEKWLLKQQHKKSWRNLRNYIGYAQYYFQNRNVKDITFGDLEDFLFDNPDLKHLSNKSRHNIKSTLHTFWTWLCKRDGNIKMPDFPDVSFELGWRKIIDKDTQDRILDKVRELSWDINPKIYIGIFFLATYINVRPIELLHIKEEDINLEYGTILVKYNKVHGKHTVVYLLDEDIEMLKTIPKGFPKQYYFRHGATRKGVNVNNMDRFGQKYWYKWWKRACAELDIQDVDLYGGTRHSTVTYLGQFYSPEEIMMDGSGHTTNKAFSRYFQRHAAQKKNLSRTVRNGQGETKVIQLNVSNQEGN